MYEHVHRQCPTYTLRVPLTILLRTIHSLYKHVHTQCPTYNKVSLRDSLRNLKYTSVCFDRTTDLFITPRQLHLYWYNVSENV